MSTLTTTPYSLPFPDGTEPVKEGDNAIGALAAAVAAKLTPHTAGALASRPTSTVGTPGVLGRKYTATDVGVSGVGITYLDLGTSWVQDLGAEALRAFTVSAPTGTSIQYSSTFSDGPGSFPRVWKDAGGVVRMAGMVRRSSGTLRELFVLPADLRPVRVATPMAFWYYLDGSGNVAGAITPVMLVVRPNGSVLHGVGYEPNGDTFTGSDVSGAISICLDNISFDPAR